MQVVIVKAALHARMSFVFEIADRYKALVSTVCVESHLKIAQYSIRMSGYERMVGRHISSYRQASQ